MRKYFCFFIFLFSLQSYADDIRGSCWDESGSNHFFANMTNGSFNSYKAGAEGSFSLSGMPGSYKIRCWIPGGISNYARMYFFIASTDLVKSENSNAWTSYFKLTDDVDVNINIDEIRGVPGTGLIIANDDIPSNIESTAGGIFYANRSTGFKVKIYARLRKDQIGGVLHIPAGLQLFRIYALIDVAVPVDQNIKNTAIMTMSTAEQYIPLPVLCKINNNAVINVNFGDIDNTRITQDGSYYGKSIPLKYSCNANINQNIDIHVIASPTSFSSDLIATSIPDSIGIMMKYNGQIIKPNGKFSTVLINGMGQDQLQVAPVINDPKKSVTGDFTASATLVMTII